MRLEVLHVPDCPNVVPMLDRLALVTDVPVTTRMIDTDADAVRFGMVGSPTLLVDGVDPFVSADDDEECACTLSCRLYRDEAGRIVPAPSVEQLRKAIVAAGQQPQDTPSGVLSAWRTRALPLDSVQRAVHQAILRCFAATGRPPGRGDLNAAASIGGGSSVEETLEALHDLDAIRLAPDGQIAIAYPFSAVPTRHGVRIAGPPGEGVDVFAMCAIDALGISAMLGRDTVIETVDVVSGRPITITTSDGRTSWEPATAVAFVGAGECGGPSADCCCDYLNVFADDGAAQAWADVHPNVPGQILSQQEAEELAVRLFGHLLSAN